MGLRVQDPEPRVDGGVGTPADDEVDVCRPTREGMTNWGNGFGISTKPESREPRSGTESHPSWPLIARSLTHHM
jgi:hypothetical protein